MRLRRVVVCNDDVDKQADGKKRSVNKEPEVEKKQGARRTSQTGASIDQFSSETSEE